MASRKFYQDCSERLKALADPSRLQLVQCLSEGESSVTELCEETGADMATVSHHLKILRLAKIVETERQGREIFYSLNPEVTNGSRPGKPCFDFGCCSFEIT